MPLIQELSVTKSQIKPNDRSRDRAVSGQEVNIGKPREEKRGSLDGRVFKTVGRGVCSFWDLLME